MKKEETKNDVFNLKDACGEAIKVVSEVKVMEGIEPVLTSGDHCSAMYLIAYKNKHIPREEAIKRIGELIKNGYVSKSLQKKAEETLDTKFGD